MRLTQKFKDDLKSFGNKLITTIFIIAVWYSVCGFIVQTLRFEIAPGNHFIIQGTITIMVFGIGTILLLAIFSKCIDLYNYMFEDEEKIIDTKVKYFETMGNDCIEELISVVGNDLQNVDSIDIAYINGTLKRLKKSLMEEYIHKKGYYPYIVLTNDYQLSITYTAKDYEPMIYSALNRSEYKALTRD